MLLDEVQELGQGSGSSPSAAALGDAGANDAEQCGADKDKLSAAAWPGAPARSSSSGWW